jgi:hypothetical protein
MWFFKKQAPCRSVVHDHSPFGGEEPPSPKPPCFPPPGYHFDVIGPGCSPYGTLASSYRLDYYFSIYLRDKKGVTYQSGDVYTALENEEEVRTKINEKMHQLIEKWHHSKKVEKMGATFAGTYPPKEI